MRYFAYGSNLDPEQLARRQVAFTDPQVALLPGYKLVFNKVAKLTAEPGEGRANIVRSRRGAVEGVVYEMPNESLDTLDWFEGAKSGHYRRTDIVVETGNASLNAVTYVAVYTQTGLRPSRWYRDTIVRGARHFGLSPDYIGALERLAVIGSAETPKERL